MNIISHKVIIIQGPLMTFGQGPNNALNGFDTSQHIISNIKNLSKFGFDHLLVTWRNDWDQHPNISKSISENKINVLLLDYPINVFDPDHRYKHHYSIRKAIEYLEEIPYQFVGKIRTDQLIPAETFKYLDSYIDDKLIVSELMRNNDYYVGDFIYYARKNVLIRFLNSQIKASIIHPIIANNIGIRYYLNVNEENSILFMIKYLLNSSDCRKKWQNFVFENISLMPEVYYKGIVWREKLIFDVIDRILFIFNEDLNQNIRSIKCSQNRVIYMFYGYRKYLTRVAKVLLQKV